MNKTEPQIEKPSIISILEGTDNRLSHLSELTYNLVRKGHQLRDTNEPQKGECTPEQEAPHSLQEMLLRQSDRLYYLNQQLEGLLNKLNELF